MYLSNFEAKTFLTENPGGTSACVHGRESIGVSRRGSTEVSSHVHSFQDEEDATNDAVFFFLQQRSHEEKQMTVILGLELTNTTSCSSSESDDQTIRPTVSTAVATFACCMQRQSSL